MTYGVECMPTYEYRCLKCKKRFEYSQKMSDKPIKVCMHCNGKVERLIGAGGGFIFKGTGFYAVDYKKTAKEQPKKESNAAAPAKKEKPAEPKKATKEKK